MMRISRGLRTALKAFIVPAVLALSAVSAQGSAPAAVKDAPPLRILNSYTIDSLDPAKSGNQWLFDFGVAENPIERTEAGELKPWLMASVDRVSDKVWSLKLRPNVTFHNGKPADAAAVVASLKRQIDKFAPAKAALGGSVIEVAGPLEVRLTTAQPIAGVPSILSGRGAFPIYDVVSVEAAGDDPNKLAVAGFYTGPYVITAYTPTLLELKRNDKYWNGRPPLPAITIKTVLDTQARIIAVQSGEADIIHYPPIEAKLAMANRKDVFFKASPLAIQSDQLYFNMRGTPSADPAVRKAITYALDYASLSNDVMDGVFDVAKSLYPAAMPFAVQNIKTDVAMAAKVLDTAGWTRTGNATRQKAGAPLRVTLVHAAQDPENKSLAVAIQAQLAKVGIEVVIKSVDDFAAGVKDPATWSFALALSGTLNEGGDPVLAMQRNFASNGDLNRMGMNNAEIDKISAALPTTFDQEEQYAMLRRAQQIMVEENNFLTVAAFKRYSVIVNAAYQDYVVSNFRRHITMATKPKL